jgi:hypothetical protein
MDNLLLNKHIHEDRTTSSRNMNDYNIINNNSRVLYIGKVISIDDKMESMRIKVRIPEFDNNVLDTNLPYCYPLHGQIFRVFPKVGESVVLMLSDIKNPYNDRLWLFPLIRTYQDKDQDNTIEGNGFIGLQGYFEKKLKSVTPFDANPNTGGILPSKDDVAIIGRQNSDIILGDNKLILRTNYVDPDDNLKLNTKNPANLILNYNKDTKETTSILRADNVLLISHDGSPNFKTIMDEKEIEEAISKCHALPYGDVLVTILRLMAKAITQHIHPFPSEPPIKDQTIIDVRDYDYNSILSKRVKIN